MDVDPLSIDSNDVRLARPEARVFGVRLGNYRPQGDDRTLSAPRSVTSYSSMLFYYADSEIRYFNLLPLKGMDS